MKYSLFALLGFIYGGCAAQGSDSKLPADAPAHHTSEGFTNRYIDAPERNFLSFLKVRFFSNEEWADHAALSDQVPVQQIELSRILSPPDKPQISWLGHATFLIQYKGMNILTDPIFSDRASPFCFMGPKRYIPHVVDYAKLPPIDVVIISHNHYDHLDELAVEMLAEQAKFFVPLGVKAWFIDQGVVGDRIVEMDWWQKNTGETMEVQALPSQHWSARGMDDRFKTLWASWSIKIDDFHLWFAGDTGYNNVQFKQIGQQLDTIDLALIPIGAYAPRWFMKYYHVNPEEAVKMHQDVKAQKSIGMHWGTFPLTAEQPGEPVIRLRDAKTHAGLPDNVFETIDVGQTIILDQ